MEQERKTGIFRTIKSIYFYLVCFVALMIVIFSVANVVYNITEIFFPIQYMPAKMDLMRMYQNDEVIKKSMTFEQFTQMQEEQMKMDAKRQQVYAIKNSVRNVSLLVISIPLYLYHWRRIREEDCK